MVGTVFVGTWGRENSDHGSLDMGVYGVGIYGDEGQKECEYSVGDVVGPCLVLEVVYTCPTVSKSIPVLGSVDNSDGDSASPVPGWNYWKDDCGGIRFKIVPKVILRI